MSSQRHGVSETPTLLRRQSSNNRKSSSPPIASSTPRNHRKSFSNDPNANARSRRMSSTSFASVKSAKSRRRSSVSTLNTTLTGSEYDDGEEGDLDDIEEWEGETISERSSAPRKKKNKKDEPMSPLAVVLYVIFFYVIWQILTRSDEHEILSHLAPSSIRSHLPDHNNGNNQGYHLPYHLPHIPSPIPPSGSGENNTSMWRIILGVAVYPIYLAVTLLAIPLPLILNALHLIWDILTTLLYPITSTTRLFTRTFVLAPLGLFRNILAAFYPVYVFVGSVVGVGCVMGLGAGWAGRRTLNWILGRKKSSTQKRRKLKRSGSSRGRSSRGDRSEVSSGNGIREPSSGESPELVTPMARVTPLFDESTQTTRSKKRMTSFSDEIRIGHARGTAREPIVVGFRKRGLRGDDYDWE